MRAAGATGSERRLATYPEVSVVIPTHRRPRAVVAAVTSALAQTRPPTEVVVVVDGYDPETVTVLHKINDPRLVVEIVQDPGGPGAARNRGVARATGDFVAFLDDDDHWLPSKLERQVATHLASPTPEDTVSATAAYWDLGHRTVTWPTRAPRPGEGIPDYLFVRRRAGEGVLATPTLMIPRQWALAVPMPTDLPTHEEWDWLLTLHARGVRAVVEMAPLARIQAQPSRSSVSSVHQNWRTSLAWAQTRRHDLGRRGFAGFVLTEAGRAATRAGAGPGTHLYLLKVASSGSPRLTDVVRHLGRPLVELVRGRRRAAGTAVLRERRSSDA